MVYVDFNFRTDKEILGKRKYYPSRLTKSYRIYDLEIARMHFEDQHGEITCPYCNERAEMVQSGVVYGYNVDYWDRIIYLCKPCESWVGTHQRNLFPLGTLAKSDLRTLRYRTHTKFDRIWKEGHLSRKRAYQWLSKKMGIEFEKTHIGFFNEKQCQIVLALVKNYFPHFFV